MSNSRGLTCDQLSVRVETIDEQVIAVLKTLKPPKNWQQGITRAMGELIGEQNLEERLQEIRDVIKRMDTRWDHGFVTDEQEFLEQRLELQQELEQLTPVPQTDLQQAADLLANFGEKWEELQEDKEAQHQLVKLIVERVYIQDEKVVAMTLKSNCHLVLGLKQNGPTEYTVDPFLYTCGSDGGSAARVDKGVGHLLSKANCKATSGNTLSSCYL